MSVKIAPKFLTPKEVAGDEALLRNFHCRHYDDCLMQAAVANVLLDCSECPLKTNGPDPFARLAKIGAAADTR